MQKAVLTLFSHSSHLQSPHHSGAHWCTVALLEHLGADVPGTGGHYVAWTRYGDQYWMRHDDAREKLVVESGGGVVRMDGVTTIVLKRTA